MVVFDARKQCKYYNDHLEQTGKTHVEINIPCPKCGTKLSTNAKFCAKCGNEQKFSSNTE